MVTLAATAKRLAPPLAAPARDARPFIAAALLHAGVAAALLVGWRDAPSEAPGSFAVSLVLEPAPAAAGAAEAMPQAASPPVEEASPAAEPTPEAMPPPPEPAAAATEPIPPAEPVPEPEAAAVPAEPPPPPVAEAAPPPEIPAASAAPLAPPTAQAVPEPEIPVATAAPAPAPIAAPPPPLPAAKPTPPRPAEAKAAPRTPAPPASPPSPARTAGDRRSTVDAPEAQVSAAGSSVEPAAPVVLDRPHYRERPAPPRYPMRARELEQQGLVLVRARLDPIGDPVEVEVLRSSGFRLLDEAAAEAVRQWRFVPARRDGHGVEALVQIPVRFTLN